MEKDKAYLDFLKFCLNDHLPVPESIKDINWHELLEFGKKHTIVGMYIPTVLMKDGKLKKAVVRDAPSGDFMICTDVPLAVRHGDEIVRSRYENGVFSFKVVNGREYNITMLNAEC